MTSQTPIVELIGITKSFGPVDVLKGIDFKVYAGRVTALVGDNGAGKSTLIKGLAGVQEYDHGVVKFEGEQVHLPSARAAAALGIEVVYQDLALCENLDIVQNMFLGRESMTGVTLNEPQMEFEASKTLTGLSVRTVKSVRQKVASLSGGQRVVYQDLALCENLDIVQNMFLGRESMTGVTLNEPQMEFEASKTLTGLSVRTVKSVRQKVASLSGGQRQTVAIARSVLRNAKVVILDEPTAALGVAQTEQVLNLVRRLADSGVAVIIISHNLQDVFKVADDIAVLYLGKMVANLESKDTNHLDVVQYITGTRTMGDQA